MGQTDGIGITWAEVAWSYVHVQCHVYAYHHLAYMYIHVMMFSLLDKVNAFVAAIIKLAGW